MIIIFFWKPKEFHRFLDHSIWHWTIRVCQRYPNYRYILYIPNFFRNGLRMFDRTWYLAHTCFLYTFIYVPIFSNKRDDLPRYDGKYYLSINVQEWYWSKLTWSILTNFSEFSSFGKSISAISRQHPFSFIFSARRGTRCISNVGIS